MPYGTDTIDSEISIRLMTYEEIATFSRENFPLDTVKGDLNPVKHDKLIAIFLSILQTMKPDMNPTQIPFEALTSIEIDGHEQYIMLRNVFVSMKSFLGSIRFDDFVFEDVVAPKPKRTQTILSILIAFLYFADSRHEKAKLLENIVNETEKKRNDIANSEPALQRRRNNAKVAMVTVEQNYIHVQKQFNEANEKVKVAVDKRDKVKKETAAKKAQIATLEQDIEIKSETSNKQQEKSDYLKSRIACSPEELEVAIAERNTMLERCKSEIQVRKSELSKLSTRKTTIDNWKSKIQKTLKIIEDISEQQQLMRSTEANLQELNYKGKTLRNEYADAQQKLEDQLTVLKLYREKFDSLSIQHQAQVNAKKKALEEAKKNKEQFSKHVNENDIVIDSLANEMEQLEININEQEAKLKELSEYPPEYFRLLKALDIFHLRLAENVQKVADDIENLRPIDITDYSRKN